MFSHSHSFPPALDSFSKRAVQWSQAGGAGRTETALKEHLQRVAVTPVGEDKTKKNFLSSLSDNTFFVPSHLDINRVVIVAMVITLNKYVFQFEVSVHNVCKKAQPPLAERQKSRQRNSDKLIKNKERYNKNSNGKHLPPCSREFANKPENCFSSKCPPLRADGVSERYDITLAPCARVIIGDVIRATSE